MKGRIYQINIKPFKEGERGIPKWPVSSAFFSYGGLDGDYNRYRIEKLGGDLDQAVLLMTSDKISELVNGGWPVSEGDLGENVNVEGIDYDLFEIQGRYLLGKNVVIEITKPCEPCKNLRQLFYVGAEHKREFVRTLVGRRGLYAKVLEEGEVKLGDEIRKL